MILTVGKLKEFIKDLDDKLEVCFRYCSDGDCDKNNCDGCPKREVDYARGVEGPFEGGNIMNPEHILIVGC